MDVDRLLARGDEELAAGRWQEARAAFEAALAEAESAPALLGLADALWWLGEASACVESMERAYALLRQHQALAEAVTTAVWLAVIYKKSLANQAACSGWVSRAARLLGDDGEGPLHGWVWLARSYEATDPERSLATARRALGLARAHGDTDLEMCALGQVGSGLVATGRVDEGLSVVDEAMAGALGEASPEAVVATTCSMLVACDLAADLERVTDWCRVADRFLRHYGGPFLYADCRMRYGSVLVATGHWEEAERELRSALRAAPAETDYHIRALASLAELRLRQGRPEEAEELVAGIADRPVARPVTAAIHQARGEHEVAAAMLTRHLERGQLSATEAAHTLAMLVESHLARGDRDAAEAASGQLGEPATRGHGGGAPGGAGHGGGRLAGEAAYAAGCVALAAGSDEEGSSLLEKAMEHFARDDLPYDMARARLALARALAATKPEVAATEAQAAHATFERLGASRHADAAAALLRSLGTPARTGPKNAGALTRRERQVLRLLGEGLSNPEIAERLFVSRKTASHHVSHVLAKIGVRNRAEAAAYATRRHPDLTAP